jgi:hypothetical protein
LRRDANTFPRPIIILCVAVATLGLLTANPLLSVSAVLVLLVIVRILWRSGEPPILIMAAGFQWTQIAAKVILADYLGVKVATLSLSPRVEEAIWLSFAGLVVLSIGTRLALRNTPPRPIAAVSGLLSRMSLDRLFAAYLAFAFVSWIVPYFAWQLLSVAQVILNVASIKWVLFYLLGVVAIRRRQNRAYFAIAMIMEFIAGVGFFSEFKLAFFFAILVLTSVHVRLTAFRAAVVAVAFVTMILTALVWQAIRVDYRSYLNQGTGQQVVLVGPLDRVTMFAKLASEVDGDDVTRAIEPLLIRLAYVDYFATVLDYVPAQRRHEGGTLWWRSIVHVLLPRLFYPGKAILPSDSELTSAYTGLMLAGADRGTSISMGYMTESYIDFAQFGMFLPIFILGLLWGYMFSFFLKRGRTPEEGFAFAAALLVNATYFEIASVKLLGGMLMTFLVLATTSWQMPRIRAWIEPTTSAS